ERLVLLRVDRPPRRRDAVQLDALPDPDPVRSSAGSRGRPRHRSAARLSRARGGDFSVCAMLPLIAAIGTTWMACDEGRKAFPPPRGPVSLHPLVARGPRFVSGPPDGPLTNSCG